MIDVGDTIEESGWFNGMSYILYAGFIPSRFAGDIAIDVKTMCEGGHEKPQIWGIRDSGTHMMQSECLTEFMDCYRGTEFKAVFMYEPHRQTWKRVS